MAPALAEPAMRTRWSDLRRRALSALLLAPIGLAVIWVGGPAFWVLAVLISAGMTMEWLRLCRHRPPGWTVMIPGLTWIWLSFLALIWLRSDPAAGRGNVMFLVVLIWANDIAAYLAGRSFGGPRLAPRISPGKTWSGAAGGVLAAIAVGVVAASLPGNGAVSATTIATSAGLAIIGQFGDLAESAAKRHFGVKDSGYLIPGHGGLLDRLDALLAVIPPAALLASLHGPGGALWQ